MKIYYRKFYLFIFALVFSSLCTEENEAFELIFEKQSLKLLEHKVYTEKQLSVFYPQTPRVPHHLIVTLNQDIKKFKDITCDQNALIFKTIKKVSQIYKTISINGFVVAQYDTPQDGHLGKYAVEIIPHLPNMGSVKNNVDKVDCNRYVLFRNATISSAVYRISKKAIENNVNFWKKAFLENLQPSNEEDFQTTYPCFRKESHMEQANQILKKHLNELLQTEELGFKHYLIPIDVQKPKITSIEKCFFCDIEIIKRQLVYESKNIYVLYNSSKGPKVASRFLIIPKRHFQKVYDLDNNEIDDIYLIRKALVNVLNKIHPECNIVTYIQDDIAVGQSVFHSHEQVVAINPETIALKWTMFSLYPNINKVSNEEMKEVTEKIGKLLKIEIENQL
jgi:diadenosine tetraphosphate (Ap4A) HIT family hydrolase